MAKRLDDEARRKYETAGKGRFLLFTGPGFQVRMEYSQLDRYNSMALSGIVRMVTADYAANWMEARQRAIRHMEALDIDLPHKGSRIINPSIHPELNQLMHSGLMRDFIRASIVIPSQRRLWLRVG